MNMRQSAGWLAVIAVALVGCGVNEKEEADARLRAQFAQQQREQQAAIDRHAAENAQREAKRDADRRESLARVDRNERRQRLRREIEMIELEIEFHEGNINRLSTMDAINRELGIFRGNQHDAEIETLRRKVENKARRVRELQRQRDLIPY